jgi:alanyl-tRNA synthetase
LTDAEIGDIERRANEIVLANFPVNTRWTSYKQALKEGVTALFTEKYGDEVRVVSFGEDESVSAELCGGTHVDSTAEIGSFRIVSEGSVAAGVRRMEVVTGRGAEQLVAERLGTLDQVATLLHTKPQDAANAVRQLAEQNQALQKELVQLRQKLARQESEALIRQATPVDSFQVLAVAVNAEDVETLRQLTDWFRDKLGSSVVAVGSVIDEKPMIVAAVTEDLVGRGLHAGNLVRDAAKLMGGGGGGKPTMAQAGGKEAGKLDEALANVVNWVRASLK